MPQDPLSADSPSLAQIALDAAEAGAWRWDIVADALDLDHRAQSLLGLRSPIAIADFYARVYAQDLAHVRDALEAACDPASADDRCSTEFRIAEGDGTLRAISTCGRAYFVGAGDARRAAYVAGILHACPPRSMQTSSEDKRDGAAMLAREHSEFAANMSHELRTPLNAVIGLAQVGVRDNFGRRSMETFQRILDSGQLLLAVVNDVLDYAKLDAGKVEIEHVPYALGAAIDKAIDLLAAQAYAKQLDLVVEEASDVPATCLGDGLRVSQVLTNLLSNAVKFTASGRVTLSVARDADSIVFRVSDTGLGMSAALLERAFEPFEQGDLSTTRRHGGTGLGLAITRRFVALMGGAIRAESRPEEGSSFEVRLPLAGAAAEAEPMAGKIVLAGLPGVEAQRLIGAFARWRIDAAIASCEVALATPCDLMLFSAAGAGPETLAQIAESLRAGKRIAFVRTPGIADVPLAFLNARTLIFDRPLRVRQCINALRNRVGEGTVSALGTPRLQGIRALAAEDSEVSRIVLEDLLKTEGATVTLVENGRQALERLHADGAHAYDVVLTDIQMPEMDGYETARELRRLAPHLPVIGVTARAGDAERERCFAAGMVGHVPKPIDVDLLIALIRRQCVHPEAVPALVHRLPEKERGSSSDTLHWIDWPAFEARYQGRSWMIDRLIATALRSHKDTASKMRAAAAARDFATLAFLAHALKGLAGNFPVAALAADAGEIEELAQQSSDEALVRAESLARLVDKLMLALATRRKSA